MNWTKIGTTHPSSQHRMRASMIYSVKCTGTSMKKMIYLKMTMRKRTRCPRTMKQQSRLNTNSVTSSVRVDLLCPITALIWLPRPLYPTVRYNKWGHTTAGNSVSGDMTAFGRLYRHTPSPPLIAPRYCDKWATDSHTVTHPSGSHLPGGRSTDRVQLHRGPQSMREDPQTVCNSTEVPNQCPHSNTHRSINAHIQTSTDQSPQSTIRVKIPHQTSRSTDRVTIPNQSPQSNMQSIMPNQTQ